MAFIVVCEDDAAVRDVPGLAVVRRLAASAGVAVRAVADGHGRVEVTFPAPEATA